MIASRCAFVASTGNGGLIAIDGLTVPAGILISFEALVAEAFMLGGGLGISGLVGDEAMLGVKSPNDEC